jgi:uncharacterized membrane protein YfcA
MMTLIILFAAGLFAGTVDAIAGGGGLISLPVLLGVGLPPHLAFGTNKLQGTIGTYMATRRYYRHGLISMNEVYLGVIFGLIGSIAGSTASQILSASFLQHIIPLLLFGILIYTIFTPKMGNTDRPAKMREALFYLVFGFGLGFYDGFFGPGTGSFWVFALTFFLGYNLIKATAYTKVFNLNSSFVATICFGLGGNIDYRYGLCMAAGSIIGGRLGASLAIKKGSRLIRPLFLCIVTLTIASLAYKNYSQYDFMQYLKHYGMMPPIMAAGGLLVSIAAMYLRKSRKSE